MLLVVIMVVSILQPPAAQASGTPTSFSQYDSRWASHPYGYSDTAGTKPATISSSGCGLLSLVNAVYYMNGNFIEPTYLADYSVRNGLRVNGVGTAHDLYRCFARDYGTTYEFRYVDTISSSNWERLRTNLQMGRAAITTVYNHLLTIVDYDPATEKYLVLDSAPASYRGTSKGYAWLKRSEFTGYMEILCSYFYILESTQHPGYIVDYDANGGTGAPSAQTKEENKALTLSSTVPTREYYKFLGWSEDKKATAAVYAPGGSYTKNEATTLYAVWSANTYTVTFDANNGTGAPSAVSGTYRSTIKLPETTPTRNGYHFAGWALSREASSYYAAGSDYVIPGGNVTLYANWKPSTTTITYDANGGTGAPAQQTKNYNAAVTLSSVVPTREGYRFLGWATTRDAQWSEFEAGGKFSLNESVTLYAVWSMGPTIEIMDATAEVPGTATVVIRVKENPGIADLTFMLGYDSNMMELSDYELAPAFDGAVIQNGTFQWSAAKNSSYSGEIVTLYFHLRNGLSVREVIPVEMQCLAADASGKSVDFYVDEGRIMIVEEHLECSFDSRETTVGPTCTEAGYTLRYCRCGKYEKTEYVPALGHDAHYTVSEEPTIVAFGTITGECSRCDEMPTVILPELNETDYTCSAVRKATCTTTGLKYYTWRNTDYGIFTFDVNIAALGHDYISGSCSRCGEKDPDTPVQTFVDVPVGAWYYDEVEYAAQSGFIQGTGNGYFKPNTAINRAMLVTLLWRYAGEPAGYTNVFTDVPAGRWYTQAIAWAAHEGIVEGVGQNRFNPEGLLNREQMATLFYRYTKATGGDTNASADLSSYPDSGSTSGWAKAAVEWAVAEGLVGGATVNGVVCINPKGEATRAQLAVIFVRYVENVEN